MYLTVENYFQKYKISHQSEYKPEFHSNATNLISRCNTFLCQILQLSTTAIQIIQSSGWRPPSINATISSARLSSHTIGKGIDLSDRKVLLTELILEYPHLLKMHGLWMENPSDAVNHVHLDIISRSDREVNIFNA